MKMHDVIVRTDRTLFNETWLFEMPFGTGSFQEFNWPNFKYQLMDVINNPNAQIEIISPGFKKIQFKETAYFWIENEAGEILIGVFLSKNPYGWAVSMSGKNPAYIKQPPFASDLHDKVLHNIQGSICLLSDIDLSDEGYNIWKRLLQAGHCISVYNEKEPGKTFKNLMSKEDMEEYFSKTDRNYKQYRYVISESHDIMETKTLFFIRDQRERRGSSLTDNYDE